MYGGLAGIALANAYLFKYFKEDSYSRRVLKVWQHIFSYAYRSKARWQLIDPLTGKLSNSYSRGTFGMYCVIKEILDIFAESRGF